MHMILVDCQHLDLTARGHTPVDPYDPKLVQPNSIGIRLGNHFVWHTPGPDGIDPYDKASVNTGVEEIYVESFVLRSRPVCSCRSP